jgi:ferredoxin
MTVENEWTEKELRGYAEGVTAVTVPVNLRIEGEQKILDLAAAERLLRSANIISLGSCGCRKRMKKCDAPLEVCLCMDEKAKEIINTGEARPVSVEQALNALKCSHETGLVHLTFIDKGEKQPLIICSCCSCCCHVLSSLLRFNIPGVAKSEQIVFQDTERCRDCGVCVKRCQFHARWLDEGELVFDKDRCFGCGLCITTCPNGALRFTRRNRP